MAVETVSCVYYSADGKSSNLTIHKHGNGALINVNQNYQQFRHELNNEEIKVIMQFLSSIITTPKPSEL